MHAAFDVVAALGPHRYAHSEQREFQVASDCRHGVPAMLVSRETTRQTIPAAFTRRMYECRTPIQAGRRESHSVRAYSQYLAGWGLIVRQLQEVVIRHAKL